MKDKQVDLPTETASSPGVGSKLSRIPSGESQLESNSLLREKWDRNIDFLFACVGHSVGLGNVWRFPYLCYKNGGGAFLLPYFVALFLGGIPVFFLEVSLGQYMSRGGIEAWNIVPLFKGIGYATIVIDFFLSCYYNVIITWAFYYLFSSFATVLPWSHCSNSWNSKFNCTVIKQQDPNQTTVRKALVDSTTEFWEYHVLAVSNKIEEVGTIKWDLLLCLMLAWVVVYLCIVKGIRTSGKVMYFTATSPYLFMLVLFIRTSLLDGASRGLWYYLIPKWNRLADIEVWSSAGTQIFFSYSISLGTLPALGSFNRFKHDSFRDSVLYALVNTFTSLFAGCVIFMTLGYMSKTNGIPIDEVAESGPGLAFVAYPQALTQMPAAPIWSVFFFIMLILLGLDSLFVSVEGLVTAISDIFPEFMHQRFHRELFTLGICILCFLVGLSMITNGGIYVFYLIDYYSGARIILLVAFFECIVISYFYGVNRYIDNIKSMFAFPLGTLFRVMLGVITPVYVLTIFIMTICLGTQLTYKRGTTSSTYHYPTYAIAIGWIMAGSSAIMVPSYAIFKLLTTKGTLRERLMVQLTTVLPLEHPDNQANEQPKESKKFYGT